MLLWPSSTRYASYCCINCCADSLHSPENDSQNESDQNDVDINGSNQIDDNRNDDNYFDRDHLDHNRSNDDQYDQRTSNDKLWVAVLCSGFCLISFRLLSREIQLHCYYGAVNHPKLFRMIDQRRFPRCHTTLSSCWGISLTCLQRSLLQSSSTLLCCHTC